MTKSLRPILAISIASLTLLSSCSNPKKEANTVFANVKMNVGNSIEVKSWDKACFAHTDVKKYLKLESNANLTSEQKADLKERGNSVSIVFVLTDTDNTEHFGMAQYYMKKDEHNINVTQIRPDSPVSATETYESMRELMASSANGQDCYTFGDLI